MTNIIQLHQTPQCICGQPGIRRDVECPDERATVFACDVCFGDTLGVLDRVRPVHTAMLAAGVPPEVATDVMGYLLDRVG